ncbi:MAG: hypothetical protein AAB454_02010 [Patescibacteria group bacterium]
MKKLILIVILILIVVGLVVLLQKQTQKEADTTSAISQDLEGIDVGELDQEFQDIDSVLETL